MNNNISREKVILVCLVMAIVMLVGVIAFEQAKIEKLQEQQAIEPGPEIITGEYTIIHYPEGGWINTIYITDYYLEGQVLHYKEKNSTDYKPI